MRNRTVLLSLILIAASLCWSQTYTLTPCISSTLIDSISGTVGSATISSTTKPFGSVVVGQQVYGPGVPYGTTVTALPDTTLDSLVVLSDTLTTSAALKTLCFGYYSHVTYASGDWLGLPFRVYQNTGVGGQLTLVSAVIDDQADVIGNTDIVFFAPWSDTLGVDTTQAAIPAAEALKVCGIVSLTTASDLGGGRVLEKDNIQLALPKNQLFARLLSKATVSPTTTIDPFKVRLLFR